jgi:hypothetical protein
MMQRDYETMSIALVTYNDWQRQMLELLKEHHTLSPYEWMQQSAVAGVPGPVFTWLVNQLREAGVIKATIISGHPIAYLLDDWTNK